MSCQFDLAHYRELLDAAKAGGYRWAGFERPPEPADLLLRHDFDLSLHEPVARGEVEWLELLIHPEIWVYEGRTMGESMCSFLDSDREARLEHLRADRIDLE